MFHTLMNMMRKPLLYEKGTVGLWTDEYISKNMLEAHLNPNSDSATRRVSTVREIVEWIASIAPARQYPQLLDLGCGPGIYAEEFYRVGYSVSGMDFSQRSISYAKNSAYKKVCL